MELVPSSHDGFFCACCEINPITGPRFTCKVCKNFNLCENCFYTKKVHKHSFYRIVEPGTPSVFAGKPGRYYKQELGELDDLIIEDWNNCVKRFSASSREAWAHCLVDGTSSCWLTCGSQGKHWLRLEMQPDILIQALFMAVDPADSSYMPSFVVISGGTSFTSLQQLNEVHVRSTDMIVTLLKDVKDYYPCIEIAIKQCRNAGIDCKLHGLSIIGKRQRQNPNLKTSASFLASDWDQSYEQPTSMPYTG